MNHPSVLLVGNFLSSHTGSRSAGEELNERLRQNGWQTITTSNKRARPARLLDMIACVFLQRNKYQIAYVEVYSGFAFLWAEIVVGLLYSLKKPCILALHGGRLPEFADGNKRRIQRLFAKSTCVTTPSHFLHERFRTIYPGIVYIPNSIDVQKYKFRKRTRTAPQLIWVRAFHSIYQPLMAVRVLEQVKKIFPNAHLTMVGADKRDGSLQQVIGAVQSAGLTNAVSIVGSVPKADIPAWLDNADIFLNTTWYESFGVSVLEAACVGLPIVTTNVGELPYLWQNESEVLLVSPEDPNEMVQAVIRILSDSTFAEKLSVHARQKAVQFDWSVIMPQWEKLLMEQGSDGRIR